MASAISEVNTSTDKKVHDIKQRIKTNELVLAVTMIATVVLSLFTLMSLVFLSEISRSQKDIDHRLGNMSVDVNALALHLYSKVSDKIAEERPYCDGSSYCILHLRNPAPISAFQQNDSPIKGKDPMLQHSPLIAWKRGSSYRPMQIVYHQESLWLSLRRDASEEPMIHSRQWVAIPHDAAASIVTVANLHRRGSIFPNGMSDSERTEWTNIRHVQDDPSHSRVFVFSTTDTE
jgi:hypothetical protein